VHAVSGINARGNLQIGFEDQPGNGAERDYNDAVIEIKVQPYHDIFLNDVAIAPEFTVTDPDHHLLASALIQFTSGHEAGDVLKLDGPLTGTNITVTQNIDGSLSLTGQDTAEHYQSALQHLTLGSTAVDPLAGTRSFSVTVTDPDGLSDHSTLTATYGLYEVTFDSIHTASILVDHEISLLANKTG